MSEFEIYLNLIEEMISKIESSEATLENLKKDFNLQDATLMRLQVIGENVKSLPSEIKKENKNIKWRRFERLRNLISHKYSVIDYELIGKFIQESLPELKEIVIKIKSRKNE